MNYFERRASVNSRLLLPFLLSFFSFPLGCLLRFIYYMILPDYGDPGIALLSIVISLNVTAIIMTLYLLLENNIKKGKEVFHEENKV